jgi:hypothetical protein
MAQARRSGPNGIALQFSANAVDENGAEKAINVKMILSIAVIGPSSVSAFPNEYLYARYQTPERGRGSGGSAGPGRTNAKPSRAAFISYRPWRKRNAGMVAGEGAPARWRLKERH